jgi:hypothetical protein
MASAVTILRATGFLEPTTNTESANAVGGHSSFGPAVVAAGTTRVMAVSIEFATSAIALAANALDDAWTALDRCADDAVDANLHAWSLLGNPASTTFGTLPLLCLPTEHVSVRGQLAMLHAPNETGRSKVADAIERFSGVSASPASFESFALTRPDPPSTTRTSPTASMYRRKRKRLRWAC